MASNTKILVVGETRDGRQWRIRNTDVTSTFSPKIFVMNEKTENEVQLFFGKDLTQKRTALLKKAFTHKNCFYVFSTCFQVKHETGFLRYKFSTSHFIDGRVFLIRFQH